MRRLRIFGEAVVLAVFDDADDLDAGAVLESVGAADGGVDGAKELAREFAIDDGDARGSLVVVPGEVAAGQAGRCRAAAKIARGDDVAEGHGGGVDGAQIGGVSLKTVGDRRSRVDRVH